LREIGGGRERVDRQTDRQIDGNIEIEGRHGERKRVTVRI
jgi:hypothetical protein